MNRIVKNAVLIIAPALFCGLSGAMIAFVPHISARINHGSWEYYHDQDEILYRLIAKPALAGSWRMTDVFVSADRQFPTTYSWMQFVPTSHLATRLGFDAINLGQFWRIFGGFGLGFSLYCVFRSFRLTSKSPALFAVLCALLALSDAGFVGGRIFYENIRMFVMMQSGVATKPEATAFLAYRVITPLWNLPVAILATSLLSPALFKKDWRFALPAVLMIGLTVSLYFFQWTALIVGAGPILLGFIVWDTYQKNDLKKASIMALLVLVMGFAAGLPQVISNASTFGEFSMKPILDRVGRGQRIPSGDPILTINLVNRWVWGKIVLAILLSCYWRNRGLVIFTSVGFAGYLLANSAILTGIEFENWHWLYVFNPYLAIVIISGLIGWLMEKNRAGMAMTIAGCFVMSSLYLRYNEADIAPEAIKVRSWFEGVRLLRNAILATNDDERVCLAGDPAGHILALSMPGGRLLFHMPHTAHTSLITLEEVHERYVLNEWLKGLTRHSLENRPASEVFKVQISAQTRPEWDREVTRKAQLEVFDRLESDEGEIMIKKYQPDWLVLKKMQPEYIPTRGGKWKKAAESETYCLWKREL